MVFDPSLRHLIREQEPLAPYTWLRIGGDAEYFAQPTSIEELQALVQQSHRAGMTVRVLGGGSNLLVNSAGISGLTLDLSAPAFSNISIQGPTLVCGAGAKLSHVITHSVGAGLGGLEHLVGIPGTLGGALHGNAATLDGDIGQRVTQARLMTRSGDIIHRNRQQLQFASHKSSLDELVTLDATLDLEPAEVRQLTQKLQTLWIVKRAHQPPLQTPAVIPFVEPDVGSMAELLDAAGMRGAIEGNVHLSSSHPSFLVSNAGATSQQVLALLSRVRDSVERVTGVQLQLHLSVW